MKNTDILIIGSSGLFGTAMEKVCKENNVNYKGFSHNDLEITNKGQLEKIINESKPEVIVNSAAMLGIDSCEEDIKKAFEINTVAVLNLAKICREKDITLVQTSSNAVFDGTKGEIYYESDVPNPKNIYGLSKYAGEICVQNNSELYYIMRFPKLFGSRKNNTLGFTDKMMVKMRKGEELKIADDRIDTFTYTIHAAREVLSLVKNKAPFGTYHIANKGSVSYYDFICRFTEKIGYHGKIIRVKDSDFPAKTPNPLRVELGSCKLEDLPSWKEALNDYVHAENIKI